MRRLLLCLLFCAALVPTEFARSQTSERAKAGNSAATPAKALSKGTKPIGGAAADSTTRPASASSRPTSRPMGAELAKLNVILPELLTRARVVDAPEPPKLMAICKVDQPDSGLTDEEKRQIAKIKQERKEQEQRFIKEDIRKFGRRTSGDFPSEIAVTEAARIEEIKQRATERSLTVFLLLDSADEQQFRSWRRNELKDVKVTIRAVDLPNTSPPGAPAKVKISLPAPDMGSPVPYQATPIARIAAHLLSANATKSPTRPTSAPTVRSPLPKR